MKMPRFTSTLHFRISALFLFLLALSAGAWWLWLNATILSPDLDDAEAQWYDERAEGELDELALELQEVIGDQAQLNDRMIRFGEHVDRYDAEVILFDDEGLNLASSLPDSLDIAVPATPSEMLSDMSAGDWDYGSYPVPDDIEAYENRIFEVDRLYAGDADSTVVGYLAASYRPMIIGVDELASDSRTIGFQALALLLASAAICGLVIMAWTTRRVRNLSAGVAAFAAGDLERRVKATSADELGVLGRSFNAMAEYIEDMVEKLRLKEQFQRQLIANISHDLRTPLASLRGYVETLSMPAGDLSVEQRNRYLATISSNIDHLDKLIQHMLVLSRFDSGQTTFTMEDFPLVELADSVLMRCEALATGAEVSLELEADEDLPMVHADPLQIAQVLQNLVDNGIKFNRPGGQVVMALRRYHDRVQVTIRDTGLGIGQDDLPHIFERFYTADKSRTRTADTSGLDKVREHLGQSSGLGLAIAARIVAGHDGELAVESELGTGTAFSFTLQAAAELKEMRGEG